MNTDASRNLLLFLDSKLNDLMFSLYRSRQALLDIQQRVETGELLARVGEALASVRESERALAACQQRLDVARRQE